MRALIATGPHGPDYQMGHAHADGLSFELYRGTQRVVTDTGTSTYDPGLRRERVRSTAAHNTMQIDGEEQLEAWGSFRVGRRGRGRAKTWDANDSWDWIIATHDGYQWLDGNPTHERLLAVSATAVWVIDRIAGTGEHEMRSAIHMHPDFPTDDVTVVALTGRAEKTPVELHERFNESRPMTEISVEVRSALPWVGGWLLLFESTGVAEAEIVEEAGLVRATCRRGSTRMQLVWNVDTSSVEFE